MEAKRKPDDIRNNRRCRRVFGSKNLFYRTIFTQILAYVKKSKQIFVVTSDSATSFPPNLLSHSRANNKSFPQKLQINLIFCAKSLCISNICCNFATQTIIYSHKFLQLWQSTFVMSAGTNMTPAKQEKRLMNFRKIGHARFAV